MINKKINLIFDFDSTFIQLETIEVLAKYALNNNNNKISIAKKIKSMTNLAMSGKLSFKKALSDRISLLELNPTHIDKTSKFLFNKISPSFNENINFIKENKRNCYIVSGGFKNIIFDIVKEFDFIDDNIFANELICHKNDTILLDTNNPLSLDNGKSKVVKQIKGHNIIIGDGYTDYEVKKYGHADIFIQYIENVNRKGLNNKADCIATNFQDIINFIKNV